MSDLESGRLPWVYLRFLENYTGLDAVKDGNYRTCQVWIVISSEPYVCIAFALRGCYDVPPMSSAIEENRSCTHVRALLIWASEAPPSSGAVGSIQSCFFRTEGPPGTSAEEAVRVGQS